MKPPTQTLFGLVTLDCVTSPKNVRGRLDAVPKYS